CIPALSRAGAKRVIPLKVSGAFHTVLMKSAAQKLERDLSRVDFNSPKIPIVQNVTADYEYNPENIKNNLLTQITHPVRWSESILKMREKGVTDFVEVGFKKVLTKLIKKIDNSSICESFLQLIKAA
ncbi:MAG: ACP S-malonyltransferase, partial [Petrotogales bacterium]